MDKLSVRLKCPKCGLPGEAVLEEASYKCILYVCPRCHSNVVCYQNKIDVITDHLLDNLLKNKKLEFCGNVKFPEERGARGPKQRKTRVKKNIRKKKSVSSTEKGPITRDDILNLKILLETEKDFDSIVSRL